MSDTSFGITGYIFLYHKMTCVCDVVHPWLGGYCSFHVESCWKNYQQRWKDDIWQRYKTPRNKHVAWLFFCDPSLMVIWDDVIWWRTSGLNWWYMTRVQHIYLFGGGRLEGKEESTPFFCNFWCFFKCFITVIKIHIIYIYTYIYIVSYSIHTTWCFYDCCTDLT